MENLKNKVVDSMTISKLNNGEIYIESGEFEGSLLNFIGAMSTQYSLNRYAKGAKDLLNWVKFRFGVGIDLDFDVFCNDTKNQRIIEFYCNGDMITKGVIPYSLIEEARKTAVDNSNNSRQMMDVFFNFVFHNAEDKSAEIGSEEFVQIYKEYQNAKVDYDARHARTYKTADWLLGTCGMNMI
jgi:hypothetical protein